MKLEIKNLSHSYGKNQVLKNINLQIEDSEILCLLGPSGCGKSTLLMCLAGFENIQKGDISYNKDVISSNVVHLRPEKRKFGIVFQDFAL